MGHMAGRGATETEGGPGLDDGDEDAIAGGTIHPHRADVADSGTRLLSLPQKGNVD